MPIKRIVHFLGKTPFLCTALVETLIVIGRLLGLPKCLLVCTRKILNEKQAEYALGFIAWFICLKSGFQVPSYNIYNLIGKDELDDVVELLKPKIGNYRVNKQYQLLIGDGIPNGIFRQHIKEMLESSFQKNRIDTSMKMQNFEVNRAFDSLCHVDSLLKRKGLHPFLISGTLLGIVRDKALIEGDNDIDIGVNESEISAFELQKFLSQDSRFLTVYELKNMVQATDRNGTVIDLFLHRDDGELTWHGSDIHQWFNSKFKLQEIDFRSHKFFIPENPEKYLNENYGNWKNPVLFWDYSFDTPNQVFTDSKRAIFFLVDRIEHEMKQKRPCRYQVQTSLEELKIRFDIDLTHHIGGGRCSQSNKDNDS